MKTWVILGIALAMTAVPLGVSVGLPACADGVDNDGDGGTDGADNECTWPGDPSEGESLGCLPEPVHRYGSGSSVGGRSATVTGGDDFGVGFVTVTDTNVADCNGDGIAGDWDGDYDAGVGGAFFGYGAWVSDPDCNYGLNIHGSSVAVNDVVYGSAIGFVVGEDDFTGPTKIPVDEDQDGIPESYVCETDGVIDPSSGRDCLSPHSVGTGATCGSGGGDGGYWVFLDGVFVDENGGVTVGNAPTTGTITAF